jgi:hypothetical protein
MSEAIIAGVGWTVPFALFIGIFGLLLVFGMAKTGGEADVRMSKAWLRREQQRQWRERRP